MCTIKIAKIKSVNKILRLCEDTGVRSEAITYYNSKSKLKVPTSLMKLLKE